MFIKKKFSNKSFKESIKFDLDNCILKDIDTSNLNESDVKKIAMNLFAQTTSTYSNVRIKLTNLNNVSYEKIDSWHNDYNNFIKESTKIIESIRNYYTFSGLPGEDDTKFRRIILENNNYVAKLADLVSEQLAKSKYNPIPNNIFLVHGHNLDVRDYFYKKLMPKYNPIVLDMEIAPGKSLLDKFMEYANISQKAIIFMTADDAVLKEDNNYMQARPNVFLELGYFLAIMEHKNIIIVKEKKVNIPSDISGVIFETYTGNKKELYNRIIKYLEV